VLHVYVVVVAPCLMQAAGMLTLLLQQQLQQLLAVVLWMVLLAAAAWSFEKYQLTVYEVTRNRVRSQIEAYLVEGMQRNPFHCITGGIRHCSDK
jgi:hypothetical protein